MDKTKLEETYMFKISIKMRFFDGTIGIKNSVFLEFRLLLSRVAP